MSPALRQRVKRLRDRLPPRVRAAVDLTVATVRDSLDDRVPGLAAEISFWALLSLPPLLLLAAAAAGVVGRAVGSDVRTQLVDRLQQLAGNVFTEDTVEQTITPALEGLLQSESTSLLSATFLVTIYSASRVLRIVVHAVTIAYDQQGQRPDWVARVLGLLYTVVGLVGGLVVIPLVVAGPRLGAIIERRLGLDMALAEIWAIAYWPTALVLVTFALAVLYHYAVPWSTPFHRELPGAALATVLGLLLSVGLRTYTQRAFGGGGVYAPLAAPLALMVWLWLQGIALLVGAELNAEIEKAYPARRPAEAAAPGLADVAQRALRRIGGQSNGRAKDSS